MCEIIFIPSFLLIIYVHSISTIQCPSCDDIVFDTTNIPLSVNQSYCEQVVESASLCRSELIVDLIDSYPAVIKYITAPLNALITNNGDSELITNINLPLDSGYPYGTVTYSCYDKSLCNNNSILQSQYKHLSELNYIEVETKLSELLYNNQSILQEDRIECYNRNNKVEKCCINWHCQATLIIERGRSDLLTTTCIPDRRPGSRTGLTIQSKSIGNDYKKTSISYTCNKNKCNNPTIVHQVRQILVEINLVDSKANNLKFVSIILLIICTIINI
ncbi:unnamed protein product [Adineta steineri]|uniref:Uncharacterized protein n=1 Tax=Adineta steineri TaxID=433720 RepID=A0A819C522_9BILA|nr:unnamed protein product [Adineta steineri]